MIGRRFLIVGGAASFLLAAMHVAILAIGAPAYLYFGRADLASAAERGSPYPALATVAVTLVLAVWGLYALSGAGILRPLPLLRTGLVAIATLYLLRGLVVILDAARWFVGEAYPPRQTVFSAGALTIGLCYAIGTVAIFEVDRKRR